jgi:omega-amidase
MQIHAVQLDCQWQDPAANQNRILELLDATAPAPGGLIILPEMALTGFTMERHPDTGSPTAADAQHRPFFHQLSQRYQCAVLGGGVSRDPITQHFHNEAIAYLPSTPDPEQPACSYRKQRPFTLGGEHLCFHPGTENSHFHHGGFHITPLICYDLRFPELSLNARQQGTQLLVFIASWPIARTQHWVTLLQARAIEHQACVIGVNRCGKDPHFTYPGRSMLIDPMGTILADAAHRETVLTTHCDPTWVTDWRETFPMRPHIPTPPQPQNASSLPE